MGAESSKLGDDVSLTASTTLSKADRIEAKSQLVANLKNQIDIFGGTRTSDRYKEFQKILAVTAEDLQKLKSSTKKQELRDRSDEVLGEVQNCLQRLETRVNFNEQSENSLDLAAVQSTSFISHGFAPQSPPPALPNHQTDAELLLPEPELESSETLDHIDQETHYLANEIKSSIELGETKQLDIYESNIQVLYDDLDKTKVDDHTPLSDKRASIGKRLIKLNNQLRKIKKTLETKDNPPPYLKQASTEPPNLSKTKKEYPDEEDDFSKIDRLLEDLEIQALTFEGVKGDKKYKELEQTVESHWTTAYSMDAFGNEERQRKLLIIDRTKSILQELRKRAEENANQAKAIKAIHNIEQHLQQLKKKASTFQGTPDDAFYHKLNQDLKNAWSTLAEVEEPNEHVRRRKATVISEIQYVLNNLPQDTKKRLSKIYENNSVLIATNLQMTDTENLQAELLKQAKVFHDHWNQLNYNLEVPKITTLDVSKTIIEILEKVIEGASKKANALSISSKTNLIDNISDSTNTMTNQPFNLPQTPHRELTKPMETEIKVQPTTKTIGELQRIGAEAKILLQQIQQSNCNKHDDQYKNFEAKLQQCQSAIEAIAYNKTSETVESNRRRAIITTNEALKALQDKPWSQLTPQQAEIKSTTAQEIMDIDVGIQYFHQQIKNFSGVTQDKQYHKIKQGLSESLSKLHSINDPLIPKQESIAQIQLCHQDLDDKLEENQKKLQASEDKAKFRRQASQDIKEVIEQVQKLKSEVEKFNGASDKLHYPQIEQNLKSCSQKLNSIDINNDDKLQNAKLKGELKIQKYLKLLQDKSTKTTAVFYDKEQQQLSQIKEEQTTSIVPDQVNQPQKPQRLSQTDSAEPHHRINSLRDKLADIKKETETFTGKFKDQQYLKLERVILNCLEELNGINDEGYKSVITSKKQYADYIQKLLEYFEEKAKTNAVEAEND